MMIVKSIVDVLLGLVLVFFPLVLMFQLTAGVVFPH